MSKMRVNLVDGCLGVRVRDRNGHGYKKKLGLGNTKSKRSC